MDYFFAHEIGLCAYVEERQFDQVRRWVAWYRRKGVGFCYLYGMGDLSRLRQQLQDEILAGLVVVININASEDGTAKRKAYNDCIGRVRYVCRYLAILEVGEYLQGPGKSISELTAFFSSNISALLFEREGGGNCYIVNPLMVVEFGDNNQLLRIKGYEMCEAKGLLVGHKRPKRIALLSHVMARNGAPLALLSVAKILKEDGYELDVYSVVPGPMEEEFKAMGIHVTVDPMLHGRPLVDQIWYHSYDLIFVNTAVMAGCFVKRLDDTPVLWWLHESKSILKWCRLDEKFTSNLKHDRVYAFGVSEVARRDFKEMAPDFPVDGILTLGVSDSYKRARRKRQQGEPFVFMMSGTIEMRKGQDIFLEAIGLMSEEERRKCEFWLVGGRGQSTQKGYEERIRSLAVKYPEVKLIDFQLHEKMLELYGKIDVFVVPSREETLSIVAIEAMMMEVPCILSDGTGVASFVEDGISGFIFHTGHASDLSEKMMMAVRNAENVHVMGQKSRHVYEKNFHQNQFAKNVLSKIESCI